MRTREHSYVRAGKANRATLKKVGRVVKLFYRNADSDPTEIMLRLEEKKKTAFATHHLLSKRAELRCSFSREKDTERHSLTHTFSGSWFVLFFFTWGFFYMFLKSGVDVVVRKFTNNICLTHPCTYQHACTRTRTHTQTNAHAHTHAHTHALSRTHAHTNAYTHAYTLMLSQSRAHNHTHTHLLPPPRIFILVPVLTCCILSVQARVSSLLY